MTTPVDPDVSMPLSRVISADTHGLKCERAMQAAEEGYAVTREAWQGFWYLILCSFRQDSFLMKLWRPNETLESYVLTQKDWEATDWRIVLNFTLWPDKDPWKPL